MAELAPSFLLFGLAAAIIFYGLKQIRACRDALRIGQASLEWPTTSGRITASQVRVMDISHNVGHIWPEVAYVYTVAGQTFVGAAIAFRNPLATRNASEATVAKYPIGNDVSVSYDPNDPRVSVLEPGTEGVRHWFVWSVIAVLVGVGMIVIGIVIPLFHLV